MMVKVEKVTGRDRVPGRVVRVVLRELGSGRRMEVVGVYAPCRGGKQKEEEISVY